MANRKYRHNANEVRTSVSVNNDLTGYDKMFKFKSTVTVDANGSGNTNTLHIIDMFGTNAGANTEELQFNYEVQMLDGTKLGSFDHNNNPINNINDAYAAPAVVTELRTGEFSINNNGGDEDVITYIKGQFNQLRYFDGGFQPSYGEDSGADGDPVGDLNPLEIMQWGNINVNQNWERFMKDADGSQVIVSATDEPKFAEGISLNRAFEDTVGNVFTADALASVNSWDSNKFGNGARVFENGSDQPNLDKWSQSGGGTSYAYYMRNDMSSITNGGKNMVPTTIAGWAGYADVSFSDSFQGATGIHNWENLNTSQCVDMQYFAWKNTRAKSLGSMRNLQTSKVENFTAMFGYAGMDNQGAEGELLIDPSNWDMKSAKTLFYMMAQETLGGSSTWNGDLNWKTMHNVVDIHSVLKNRNGYTGERLDDFAQHSGNVVLFRSAFAGTGINHDFSNWDFSGVDATRTDITYNENNSSGIMGGFVRDCENMSFLNVLKLLRALNRPFGEGGLPVLGVDPQIGTAAQEIGFGTSYETRASNMGYDVNQYGITQAELDELQSVITELGVKGYNVTGLEDI